MYLVGDILDRLRIAACPVAFQGLLRAVLPSLDLWQANACRVRSPGLLLLCGRQTGKSTVSALIAVWKVVCEPNTLVLLISPTQRQSTELFRKAMVLFEALKADPPPISQTKTELVLPNGSKIVSLPGANPDAIRGYSAPDLIIEDEAAFVNDRTFVACRPMLATNARGRHILLTTPYGRRGHFYDMWVGDDPYWQRMSIRSDQCPRIAQSFLEAEQRSLSDRAYRQEYLCEFLEAANAVFPADLLERLVDDEARKIELPDDHRAESYQPDDDAEAAIMRLVRESSVYADI